MVPSELTRQHPTRSADHSRRRFRDNASAGANHPATDGVRIGASRAAEYNEQRSHQGRGCRQDAAADLS